MGVMGAVREPQASRRSRATSFFTDLVTQSAMEASTGQRDRVCDSRLASGITSWVDSNTEAAASAQDWSGRQ